MQEVNQFLKDLDGFIGSANWFAYALLGVGLFFTLYLGFPQIRYFGQALRIVRGKYDKDGDEGDTSHFQALTTALSGTVGTGNIAGVALAVYIGGPAAIFWMLVTAFLGMTTKFVEVTLSHKYREKSADGSMAGGPMYYMSKRLNIKRKDGSEIKTGKALAIFFAIATVISSFGTGNLPQSNSMASAVQTTFGIEQWIVGAVFGVFLFLVIVGGIKRIASVTERLVPTMAALYLIGAFAVIFNNYENIWPSFTSIFTQVFTGSAAVGGFLGATFSFAFIKGVGRGLFSNEAGQGSAPIAHSAAKANEPVSEGMVALLEPFIDTIIICTITGLVLLSSGVWNEKHTNIFENTDLEVMEGQYFESNPDHKEAIRLHLNDVEKLPTVSGILQVENGQIQGGDLTIIHARSFADSVRVLKDDQLYTGQITLVNGALGSLSIEQALKEKTRLPENIRQQLAGAKPGEEDKYAQYLSQADVTLTGRSMVHSAPLTSIAFERGWFGEYGKYIVSIGLMLFAFSTAISWSYYGDRAMTFLFGSGSVVYYRVVYVAGFIIASFSDTTIVWNIAAIAIAVMTLPNLLGITLLSGEMKETVNQYWTDFRERWPKK